jgi:hypothetical protein
MADPIQGITEEMDIEDHTFSDDDDDASLNLDDIFNIYSEDKKAAKPSVHRCDLCTGMFLSAVGSYPTSWGDDSGLTRVWDFEESPNSEVEAARMAPVPPVPYSPTKSTDPLRLDIDESVKATFPSDSDPQLLYDDLTWWNYNNGGTVVSPGHEEALEAAPLPPPMNRRVTPPPVVLRKLSVALRSPPPPGQAVVVSPRPTKRKRVQKRDPRKTEPKAKLFVTKTPLDFLLGKNDVDVSLPDRCQ